MADSETIAIDAGIAAVVAITTFAVSVVSAAAAAV